MNDIIILTRHQNEEGDNSPATFGIHFARFRSEAHLEPFLAGRAFPQLNEHSALELGEIYAPDGSPIQGHEFGRPAIHSLDAAVQVAKVARSNPESEIAAKGFTAATPIYWFRKGLLAERVD